MGQPELVDKLSSAPFRQLNQRISVRASLSHLSSQATADYLATRLHRAGARAATLFDPTASQEIYRSSNGVPRLINLIASRSLMVGFLEGKPVVQQRQAALAAKEVVQQERQAEKRNPTRTAQLWWLAAAGMVVLVVLLVMFWRG